MSLRRSGLPILLSVLNPRRCDNKLGEYWLNISNNKLPQLIKLHARGYGADDFSPRLMFEHRKRAGANNGVEGRVYQPIWTDQRLHVGTCRLPGPTHSDARSMGRLEMAEEFLNYQDKSYDGNFVLAGDMNWDEDLDGPFPIEGQQGRVVDAWLELRGEDGWTYDVVANPMLSGRNLERKSPDRLCKLRDFELDSSIEMVGTEAIPGLTYFGAEGRVLPVLPSHLFGLVLTISRKDDRDYPRWEYLGVVT
uniref:Endonuclease/exonuclease/phosphatase domain-containing protein n=1 Tax=Brachypodium distachyon TaxID=15368 RepID=A0A341HZF5_BRADI